MDKILNISVKILTGFICASIIFFTIKIIIIALLKSS